jgi:hypothetical protein
MPRPQGDASKKTCDAQLVETACDGAMDEKVSLDVINKVPS